MLVFRGGLTRKEVRMFKKNKFVLQKKIPKEDIYIPSVNTFDYYNPNYSYTNYDEVKEYVSEDMYQKQYVFFYKYINDALSVCNFNCNYIIVVDINPDILSKYIGCGLYNYATKYRIEYRIPRVFIQKDDIKDYIRCYSLIDYLRYCRQNYGIYYALTKEEEIEANTLISNQKLLFNKEKVLKYK